MRKCKYRLAIIAPHPIQYQAPLFKKIAQDPKIEPVVYYCSKIGLEEYRDQGFGKSLKWDIPLLSGYKYKFLKNLNLSRQPGLLALVNLGIVKEVLRNNYDAILIDGWMSVTNLLAVLAAFLTRTAILLRCETPLNQELLKPAWKKAVKKYILRFFFSKFSAFLYIGEENKKFYVFHGVPSQKLFFCPYAVDNARFKSGYRQLKDRKDEFKKGLGISPEKVVILFCGKLMPRKDPLDLLWAYEKIGYPHKALVYVGDGVLKEAMESFVRKKGIESVYLAGFKNQTELPYYYALADIFVLPSKLDTWGLVVNEAMCFKLPVIVSNLTGCAPDLVKDGENGYIFPDGAVDKLAFFLQGLCQDKEKRLKFGEKSFEIAENYSYEQDAAGILKALESVV